MGQIVSWLSTTGSVTIVAHDHRKVGCALTRGIVTPADAPDIDMNRSLYVRLPGRHQVHPATVEADDAELVRFPLDRFEQFDGRIGARP